MKKYFLLLTASLSLTVSYGQTNVYQPFPKDSAVWYYGWTGGYWKRTQWLGDTIINSVSYKKIFTEQNSVPLSYSGGVRQDIPNEKIYEIDLNGIEHDVSLSQHLVTGDSLPPPTFGCSSHYWLIISIDSVLIGTKYHKRYNMNAIGGGGLYTWTYVVGVGTVHYQEWNVCYYGLSCFSVNNINLLGNPSNCQLVSIDETIRNENGMSIVPNPFSIQTTLQTTKPLQNASLTVYNSVGHTVKRVDNLAGQTVLFQRDNLPSGLYFVRLTQDSNTISADKFVITDK